MNNNKISLRQLQILMTMNVLGVSLSVLPQTLCKNAKQDSWIALIISLVFVMFYFCLINFVMSKFPNENFFEIAKNLFSKPIAIILSHVFILSMILNSSIILSLFTQIIKNKVLFATPRWIISFTIIICAIYICIKGIEVRARVAELLIGFVLIVLLFTIIVAGFDSDFSNLLPIARTNPFELLKSGFFGSLYFFEFQFCFLVYPFVTRQDKIYKAVSKSIICMGIILTSIFIVIIAKFGYQEIISKEWSVLELMYAIDIPDSFLERQDAIIIGFWIITMFSILNAGVFFSSLLTKNTFGIKNQTCSIIFCAIITFILSSVPRKIQQIYSLIDIYSKVFGSFFLIILPMISIIAWKIKNKRGEQE